MNKEKQRIAIARACGWTCNEYDNGLWWHQDCVFCQDGRYTDEDHIPDYLNDLNAIHEAEKTLADMASDDGGADQLGYAETLADVLGAKWAANNAYDIWLLTHATAAQRAEAFLKTIGKWEDGE